MPTKVPLPSSGLSGVEESTAMRRATSLDDRSAARYVPVKFGFRFSRKARVPSA